MKNNEARNRYRFPPLYYPESAEELLTDQILSKLMLGFTTGLGQIPVALYDRKTRYDLFGDPFNFWASFCQKFRREFGQEKTCLDWDESVAKLLLSDPQQTIPGEREKYKTLFECHAHMMDMTEIISVGGRKFAVLFGGQICSWKRGWETRMQDRLNELFPGNTDVIDSLITSAKNDDKNNLGEIKSKERLEQFRIFAKEMQELMEKLYEERRAASEESLLKAAMEVLTMDQSTKMEDWWQNINYVLNATCRATRIKRMAFLMGTEEQRFKVILKASGDSESWGNESTKIGSFWEVIRYKPTFVNTQTWASRFYQDLGIDKNEPCCIFAGLYKEDTVRTIPVLLICCGAEMEIPRMNSFAKRLLEEFLRSIVDKSQRLKLRDAGIYAVYISHDIKFPLHTAMTLAEAIEYDLHKMQLEKAELSEKLVSLKKALIEAKNKARPLDNLPATDMTITCEKTPLDILPVIDKAVEFANIIEQKRGISAKWIKRPDKSVILSLDKEYISTAFDAILENAVKYSFDHTQVRVFAGIKDNWFELQISNLGVGIPPSLQIDIFEFGKRAEIEDEFRGRSRKGTGIGLALANKIIEAHKGIITLESRPRKGVLPIQDNYLGHKVTVTVRLPYFEGENDERG